MTGLEGLLFLARRYLGVLLAALPWLIVGVIAEAGLGGLPGPGRRLPGPVDALRPILSRTFHPLLLISLFVVFRRQLGLPLYYLTYAVLTSLFLLLPAWLLGLGRRPPGGSAPDEASAQPGLSRLLQSSYDHAVDLLFGAFLAAALHSLLGQTGLGSRTYAATAIAYLVGALGSVPPATAATVGLSLLPVGQPSITLAYLLGTAWGSYKVAYRLGRQQGAVAAAIIVILLLVVSVLLSSPVTWSTLELLS